MSCRHFQGYVGAAQVGRCHHPEIALHVDVRYCATCQFRAEGEPPAAVALPGTSSAPASGRTSAPWTFPAPSGPGTQLKWLLQRLGIAAGDCGCNARAAQMDAWGIRGCWRERRAIIGWLVGEARTRGLRWPRLHHAGAVLLLCAVLCIPLPKALQR